MRPSFVVIGAMKAGSTTLYSDLTAQPKIFLPLKELSYLNQRDILDDAGRVRYDALFEDAREDQIVGDASANYAKLPEASGGTAQRAAALLGHEFSVLYIVRDPVDRIVSQHHHELSRGKITEPSIDRAVRSVPMLLDYSRYGYQLQPWVDMVGPDRVRVIKLEDYRQDRVAGVGAVLDFLGAGPVSDATALDQVHNASEGLQIAVGVRAKLMRSKAYRIYLRPVLPRRLRTAGRNAVLTTAPPRPAAPTLDTVDFILDAVRPDLARLAALGVDLPPMWDLDATRARYAAQAAG